MKNLRLLIVMWLSSFFSYGQIISVNDASHPESSYGLKQLIKDVLISSDCSTVSNFSSQVKGMPTDLVNKSYGYFKTPSGSAFPFSEGIILTTGRAHPAGNTINTTRIDYANALNGDSDLENALNINNTFDATFIKFNFVPQVNEISFRFIMGSEEYGGNTECQYADGFAFLLREVGTQNYTNLAVLPDGTTVSVTNINNSTQCKKNPQYFAGYNPTTTNYGGHSKVLTAKSTVTPGSTYEIKLVVADQRDNKWDSAIFLEAGSFDLGGDLGPDRTIANGTPGCKGTSIILNAKLPAKNITFKWYKNNVLIPGAIYSKLDATTNGTYKFEATTDSGCTATDDIVLEFVNPPVITKEVTLTQCDTDNDGFVEFNLNEANSLISKNYKQENFTFYKTKADASASINLIQKPKAYTNESKINDLVYARIETNKQCYQIALIKLAVGVTKVSNKFHLKYDKCDDDLLDNDATNGIASINFSDATAKVLAQLPKGQNLTVSYYESELDALAEQNPIIDISNHRNIKSPKTQKIYVRVDNKDLNSCLGLGHHITLNVYPLPKKQTLEDFKICDNSDPIFDLTQMNSQIIGYQKENLNISYHLSKSDAEQNIPIKNPKAFVSTTNPQIIFVSVHLDPNKNQILDSGECMRTDMNFKLIKSYSLENVTTTFLLPEFSTPNKVKVEVKVKGDYEYALDDGPWQKENILANVYHGEHLIHVRDRYGCAVKTIRIVNIDYPKYFTPNGDGYHDTWNISSLKTQANAKIYIFDRYGKLLKELSPASDGWDGTFNGQPLPTTDYWFLVEYQSPTTKSIEQFRAHFTLKR